jgi:hypothetical protein
VRIRDIYFRLRKSLDVVSALERKAGGSVLLNDSEQVLLYEALFARVFREYENFLEDSFVSYLAGEPGISGRRVEVFASPRDREHARKMLIASSPYLDWTKPTVVRERCEIWLNDPEQRFYTGIVSSLVWHGQAKDLRNHISHNSAESSIAYGKLISSLHLVAPVEDMPPGELLRAVPTKGPSKGVEVLSYFVANIEGTAAYLAEAPSRR